MGTTPRASRAAWCVPSISYFPPAPAPVLTRGLGRSYGDASLPAAADGAAWSDPARRPHPRLRSRDRRAPREAGLSPGRDQPRVHAARLVHAGHARAPSSSRSAAWSPPTCTARTIMSPAASASTCALCAARRRRRASSSAARRAERELFRATLGGMGLTGHILEVEFRLRRIASPVDRRRERARARPRRDARRPARRRAASWPFTVGWIDCLARGPRARARHPDERPLGRARARRRRAPPRRRGALGVPFDAADWLLNPAIMRLFNALYLPAARRAPRDRGIVHPRAVLLPARRDARLEPALRRARLHASTSACCRARPGPRAVARAPASARRRGGRASFLSVIKDCGPEGRGMLSFPLDGHVARARHPVSGAATPQAWSTTLNAVVIASRRPHLPRQGCAHARRALRAHGAAPRRVQRGARPWDPERRLRARSRSACSETAREGRRCSARPSGMGRALARLLAERGDALFLLGRDAGRSGAQRRDLEMRGAPAPVGVGARCDLADAGGLRAGARRRGAALGGFDRSSSPPGCSPRQDELEPTIPRGRASAHADFTNTVAASASWRAERLRARRRRHASACSARWPAIARGASRCCLYGAAKAGLSHYLDGLDHSSTPPRPERRLREARLREDGDDRRSARAAVRGRAGGRRRGVAARHRPRHARSSTRPASGAGSCSSSAAAPRASCGA